MTTNKSTDSSSSISDLDNPLFFGDWLKCRRKQLDMTQSELADRACCSIFALRKIEAGDRRPSKVLAGMLAKALGIPEKDQTIFIKVARGDLGVEKLHSPTSDTTPTEKPNPIPGYLPRALTSFIGREAELDTLGKLLRDPQCSLLTIVGPGGIGKTRLAIETVIQSKDLYPDGAWFISLASLNTPAQIIPAIADAVGFKFQDPTVMQAQLIRYLRPKRVLLALDNAEHLLEGAEIYSELLKDCQQIKLLVTSRERLNLLSEWVFEIQGLPVPPNDQVSQLDTFSSVALFLQSARRVQADFLLRDEDSRWVIRICQIMEGMPLGIELSAAWVGLLSIEEIAKEIEHNLDFLSVSMRDLPERHRSLRATLDHSWKLLIAEEKLMLSRLSVFRGGFHRGAAEEICGANLAVLSSLKNKTLLYRNDENFYALHEVVRQYAGLKLAEDPAESERIKDRHAIYFVQYLADSEKALQGPRQVETFDEMARIIDDLSWGWLHKISHCRPDLEKRQSFPAGMLHSALFSLSLFYEERHRSLEAITIFAESLDNLNNIQADFNETEDAACFNSVLYHITAYLGLHHVYIHQYEKANAYLETAINGLGDEKSRVERAQAMVMLAAIKHVNEQFQSAAELGVQSREIFREAGDEWWYVLAGINLATTYYSMGELAEAEALYQEASRLVKPGDLRLKIPLTIGSAYTLFLHNDFDKAEQLLLDTMPLCDNTLDILWYSRILYYLGLVAYATQRVELAESYFHKCIELQKEYGEHSILAAATLHLGNCYAARGDRDTARQQSRQVMRIGQEFNQFHLVYYALVFTARTYMVEGKTEQALEIYLLLNRCPVEYKGMQYEYALLQTELQAALSEGKMETELKQLDGEVSFDQARADVLKYVQEHESG